MGPLRTTLGGAHTAFFLCLALGASALFGLGNWEADPDMFWHLRVAELIRAAGPRPLVDTFSYNSVSQPWIPYSWLAELGMLRAMESGGTWALVLVPFLCYLTTLFFIALCVVRQAGISLKAATVMSVVALLLLPFIAFRPATFTFPLCAFAVWAVTSARLTGGRVLMLSLLVPLTVLLANLHLFFVFPPILLVVWAMGGWLEGRAAESTPRPSPLIYATVALLSFSLAIALNPFGAGLLKVFAHYLFEDVMVTQAVIVEMRPFYGLGPIPLWGTVLLLAWPLAGWALRRFRADWRDLGFFGLAVALVLTHGRYIPLAALLLAPLAATYGPWPQLSLVSARRLSAAAVGLVLGLTVAAALHGSRTDLESNLSDHLESHTGYPVAAARFVRQAMPGTTGRLINEMSWGGYLIYALWPDFQVLLDGRTQVYPESLWRAAYVDASRQSRRELFRRAQADVAVLPVGSDWAQILESELGWRRIYVDRIAGVWVPEAGRPLATRLRASRPRSSLLTRAPAALDYPPLVAIRTIDTTVSSH